MAVIFEVYREGTRLEEFVPRAALVVGPESVPLAGEILFRDSLLRINRIDDSAVGLSLLWDIGPLGAFQMETTRLPHRPEPYNLNVELARGRLMKIVQKQEDWNLFDFPKAEKHQETLRQAQALFAESLGKLDEPAAAAKLADQSLTLAVDLSEQLALFHAELLLNRRRSLGQFARFPIGCRVDPSIQNQRYRDVLGGSFDYAVLPMRWRDMQPQEGQFDTEAVDQWIELLGHRRIPVIAGPLIQLDEQNVPDWMFIWEHDFDTLREMAYEYVQKITQRYRKAVSMWNVCAGLHANKLFPMSFEQIIELTRLLVSQIKAMLPTARTLITLTQPFAEYHGKMPTSVPPMLYAEMVAQGGINFEGFGLELELGVPEPPHFMRDLFQISALLDKFSTLGKPVFITAICAPGLNSPDPEDRSQGALNPAEAGRWRRPWDPALQSEWMSAVYQIAMSKPYVESLAWSNLADLAPTLPHGGLLDDMFKPKPAFTTLQSLRENFHKWTKK